jgi:phosphomannomutase
MTEATVQAALRWIQGDPDPATRAELGRLVDARATAELAERMAGELVFGTAGLRGRLGAGPARMNRATVIRASFAVGRYLTMHLGEASARPVVVGYDARHQSRTFAEDTAGVLAALEISVRFFPEAVPTPLVAYAAVALGAAAAVVITASHNPADYNGYKLYGGDATQILPPADSEIAALVESAPPANAIARIGCVFSGTNPLVVPLDPGIFEEYLSRLDELRPAVRTDRSVRIGYTPLHGVGWRYAERALRRAGYQDLSVVSAQSKPDPDFPTVPRPNPEEPGTLDMAKELGRAEQKDLVLVNDPDADRLSVCVPRRDGSFGELNGDQIGVLLADFLLTHAPRPVLVVTTVVSSAMLGSIARAHCASLEVTLTGFKWICSAGLELERRRGTRFLFGYEEAYGYAVPLVRDKDGISAAVLFADLAAWCKAQGITVREQLDRLYHRHGLWVSRQRNVVLPGNVGLARIESAMRRLIGAFPDALAGRPVTSVVDYRADAEHRPRWLPAASLVELKLDGSSRVLVRPSGTEPKLKIYVDLEVPLASDEDACTREATAVQEADAISEHLARWLGLG